MLAMKVFVLVLLTLPCESCTPSLGTGRFTKIPVVFVGGQETGTRDWKEEKTSIKTGQKNPCKAVARNVW